MDTASRAMFRAALSFSVKVSTAMTANKLLTIAERFSSLRVDVVAVQAGQNSLCATATTAVL